MTAPIITNKGTLNGTSANETLYAQQHTNPWGDPLHPQYDLYTTVNGKGGDDTIYGSDLGVNILDLGFTLDGGSGDDLIYGGEKADYIYGGAGEDWLHGGAGEDWLEGGGGNDIILTGPVGYGDKNIVIGGAGSDVIYLGGGSAPNTGENSIDVTEVVLGFLGAVGSLVPVIGFSVGITNTILSIIGGSSTTPMISKYADDYVKVGDFDPSEDMVILPISSDADFSVEYEKINSADDADLVSSGLTGLKIGAGNGSTIANLFGDKFKNHENLWEQVIDNRITIRIDNEDNKQIYQASTDQYISEDELKASFGDDTADVFQSLNTGDMVVILGAYGPQDLKGDRDANALDDDLVGTIYDDTLTGGKGNDTLYGKAGDDYFDGGDGADTFRGGTGFDTVSYVDSPSGITISLNYNQTYNDDGFGYKDSLIKIEGVIGSQYDDEIVGDIDYSNELLGKAGADTLKGGAQADTLKGGTGHDLLYGEEGDDYMSGYDDDDTLHGGIGNDEIFGGWGDDSLHGEEGDDYMSGYGNDDILYGGIGNDEIFGGLDNDSLYGEEGNDRLYGGTYNDTLNGGSGYDTLTGGSAADTFIFDDLDGPFKETPDIITDFSASEGDIIQLDSSALGTIDDIDFTYDSSSQSGTLSIGHVYKWGYTVAESSDIFIIENLSDALTFNVATDVVVV